MFRRLLKAAHSWLGDALDEDGDENENAEHERREVFNTGFVFECRHCGGTNHARVLLGVSSDCSLARFVHPRDAVAWREGMLFADVTDTPLDTYIVHDSDKTTRRPPRDEEA